MTDLKLFIQIHGTKIRDTGTSPAAFNSHVDVYFQSKDFTSETPSLISYVTLKHFSRYCPVYIPSSTLVHCNKQFKIIVLLFLGSMTVSSECPQFCCSIPIFKNTFCSPMSAKLTLCYMNVKWIFIGFY